MTEQITIDGEPVLVDHEGEIQDWIDSYLTTCDLFPPEYSDVDEYFQLHFPKLPKVTLGQIQWPCVGASRYARALFAVDRHTLFKILETAWGITPPETPLGAIPAPWEQTQNSSVTITVVGLTADPKIEIKMWVLAPIRISDDCWIIRLVDWRYFCQSTCKHNNTKQTQGEFAERGWGKPDVKWTDLFSWFNGTDDFDVTHSIITVDEITNPHLMLMNGKQTPIPFLIDAACLSLGSRPVVLMDATGNTVKVVCEKHGPATTKRDTLLEEDRVTGNTSNTKFKPKAIHFETLMAKSYFGPIRTSALRKTYSHDLELDGFADSLNFRSLFVVHKFLQSSGSSDAGFDTTDFEAYCEYFKDQIEPWYEEEYLVSLPGLVKLVPSGFDDWILHDTQKGITTVKSMPIDFNHEYLLAVAPCNNASLNAGVDARWYHTEKEAIVAKTTTEIAGAGKDEESGLRKAAYGRCQLMDSWLHIAGTDTFGKAIVVVANAQKASIPSGTIVHLAWLNTIHMNGLVREPYEGWVIDWVDC